MTNRSGRTTTRITARCLLPSLMPEDPITRGIPEITADIYRLEVKVGNVRAGLTGGYAPHLADELAEHWPKPDPAA